MVDRLSPTLRPAGPVVGYQQWRHLLFLHWAVPTAALRRCVPEPLQLDLLRGEGLVGVVPFAMEDVRAAWWPRSWSLNFLETNVRAYVTYRGVPGVYFLSLEAGSRLAVWGARWGWSLPYYYARMRMDHRQHAILYHSQRAGNAAALNVCFEPIEEMQPSSPESDEFFLLERYRLFVVRRNRVYQGAVHHHPYPTWSVNTGPVDESLLAAAGLPPATGRPLFAHYSPGVDVEIFGLKPVG